MKKSQALKMAAKEVLIPVICAFLAIFVIFGVIIALGFIFGPMLAYIIFLVSSLVGVIGYVFYDFYQFALTLDEE